MSTSIFEVCDFSISGIKKVYIASRQFNGNVIQFPLNYIVKSGSSESIIIVNNWDYGANTCKIGNQTIEWLEIDEGITFNEEYIENNKGKQYKKTLELQIPYVYFTSNAAMKELIFTAEGQFAVSNAVAFLLDDNDKHWIVGYDLPLILQDGMELQIADDNYYKLTFQSLSYSRTRMYEMV